MNKFISSMQKHSTKKLVEIVHFFKDDYQEEAYDAAREVLKSRELSALEVENILQEIRTENDSANQPSQFQKVVEKNKDLFDPFNPNPKAKKVIKYLCITLAIGYLVSSVDNISIIASLFGEYSFDYHVLWLLIPLIIIPIAIYNLWTFKKRGWIIAVAYFSYSLSSFVIFNLTSIFKWIKKPTFSRENNPEFTLFDESIPSYSDSYFLASTIVQSLLLVLVLYILNKPSIKNLFQVNRKNQIEWILYPFFIGLFFNTLYYILLS